MSSTSLVPVSGVIQNITPFNNNCCQQQITIRNSDGINNFIAGPDTYIVNETLLRPGMTVTAFYDASLPIPLIYPPQYQAVIISRQNPRENIFAGYFDDTLTAQENALRLNIGHSTEVVTSNGQRFSCRPVQQMLIVYYTETTRSIPPQTTPRKIIVLC